MKDSEVFVDSSEMTEAECRAMDIDYIQPKVENEEKKMAETSEMELGIGTEEATTLKPAKVSIKVVEINELGEKKSKKVVCFCKHPEKEENISISSIKYENKGKLEVSGLWVNKDGQGLIRKGSALAVFLNTMGCSKVVELEGKEVSTVTDEKGYLCFKGY